MNISKPSENLKFGLVAGITGVAALLSFVLWQSVVAQAYGSGINRLVERGDRLAKSEPAQALVHYQAADAVSGASSALVIKEADLLEELGDYDAAAKHWRRLPASQGGQQEAEMWLRAGDLDKAYAVASKLEKTPTNLIQLSRIELERGNTAAAVSYATAAGPTVEGDRGEQAALAMAAAGLKDELGTYAPSVTDSRAAQTLMLARASKTSLAAVLQARGLVHASQRVLLAVPDSVRMAQDNILLARSYIMLANQSRKQAVRNDLLAKARDSLVAAAKLDIVSLETHQLLRAIYLELKDQAAADKEAAIIQKLQTGKI